MNRFNRQITFLKEIDKLKQIKRQTILLDKSRHENDAEHSWHLAMAVLVLGEHSNYKTFDLLKVLKMVLIHDIVEVDAGDTYAYDELAHKGKYERELKAANRIFGLLPNDQCQQLKNLWEEFEAGNTNEAKLANALDRYMPMLHNYSTEGQQWKHHGVTKKMAIERNQNIQDGSKYIWEEVLKMVDDAVRKGMLAME